jgi:hypothetical protein
MRAEVEGCEVFASFSLGIEAEANAGLGGIASSEVLPTSWPLFFFLAIMIDSDLAIITELNNQKDL